MAVLFTYNNINVEYVSVCLCVCVRVFVGVVCKVCTLQKLSLDRFATAF